MLEVGETVERYRIEALLGGGALATVYRVRHLQLDTVHALKVLTATTPTDRARLFAEGQIQAKLRHPNVVGVSDVLLVDRTPALVLELVEGPSLQRWLETNPGPVPLAEALGLFRGIVAGVGVAHAAGLVHRDLKPSNVLLGRSRPNGWIAKVTDFGLVRVPGAESPLTRTGTAIGTPAYTAPEQIRNPAAVDARADLWALGCVLYELVSGVRAFPATDPLALYEDVAAARYVDLARVEPEATVPVRVTDVIRDLLRTDPNARIVSCAHLWERLWDDPAPPELHVGDRLMLEVPAALEPPAPLLVSLEPETSGLDAPPTLVPPDDELPFIDEHEPVTDAFFQEAPAAVAPPPMVRRTPPPRITDRPLWAWPAGLGAAALVAVIPTAIFLLAREPMRPRAVPEPAPIQTAMIVPVPDPLPAVVPAEVPAPPPVPAVVPAAVPAVVPPAAPVPTAPRPARGTGTVSIEGDATAVWLESSGKRIEARGQVPVGRYVVRASFGDGLARSAGEIQIRAGGETRVRCASFVYACTEVHRKKP